MQGPANNSGGGQMFPGGGGQQSGGGGNQFNNQQWNAGGSGGSGGGNQGQFMRGGAGFQGQMGQGRPPMMGECIKRAHVLLRQIHCIRLLHAGMNQQQGGYGNRQQGNYLQNPSNVNIGAFRQQQPNSGGNSQQQQPSQAALQNPQLMAQLQRGQQQQYQQNRY